MLRKKLALKMKISIISAKNEKVREILGIIICLYLMRLFPLNDFVLKQGLKYLLYLNIV